MPEACKLVDSVGKPTVVLAAVVVGLLSTIGCQSELAKPQIAETSVAAPAERTATEISGLPHITTACVVGIDTELEVQLSPNGKRIGVTFAKRNIIQA